MRCFMRGYIESGKFVAAVCDLRGGIEKLSSHITM